MSIRPRVNNLPSLDSVQYNAGWSQPQVQQPPAIGAAAMEVWEGEKEALAASAAAAAAANADRERLLLRLDQYDLVEREVMGDGACQVRDLSVDRGILLSRVPGRRLGHTCRSHLRRLSTSAYLFVDLSL